MLRRELQAICISLQGVSLWFSLSTAAVAAVFQLLPTSALNPPPQEVTACMKHHCLTPTPQSKALFHPLILILQSKEVKNRQATKPQASTRTCPAMLPCARTLWVSKAVKPKQRLLCHLTLFHISHSPWLCSSAPSFSSGELGRGGRAGKVSARAGCSRLAGAALHTYQQTSAAPEGEHGCSQSRLQGSFNPFPAKAKRLLESWKSAGERNPLKGRAS